MRLDQASRNAHTRSDEAAVELDRCAAGRGAAEIDMIGLVARVMVFNPDVLTHGSPTSFSRAFTKVRTMQAGGDQNGDAVKRNA